MNIIYDLNFGLWIEAFGLMGTNSVLIALIANQPNKQIEVPNWTFLSGSFAGFRGDL